MNDAVNDTPDTEVAVPRHPSELYSGNRTAVYFPDIVDAAQSSASRCDAVEYFRLHGYLAIERAFPREMATAAAAAVDALIDGGREDFRGVQFEAGVGDRKALVGEERRVGVRKLMSYVKYDRRFVAIAEFPPLLGLLRALLDAEPELFQEMALLKPPRIGREKPWHQDCAYFNLPLGTPVVGVFVALDEATVANGALHVIPGSHRDGPVAHFKRRDWQICDSDVEVARGVAVPLPPGGALFWHGMSHHGSPTNRSDRRRRALQLHYRPQRAETIETEERMQLFGGDVRGATC